ncbi:MAG TPA: caspase family protein [Myxococcota bacterium]|nr:caspase family protein [Myxococcota bacterium]
MRRWLPALLLTSTLAQAEEPGQGGAPTFVAVVVGLSLYEHLPDEVELDFARSDAATVADALQDLGMYDYVFLLTDREATREKLADTLRTKAAQFTGPNDTLLVYFVGHGVGAELGRPTLLVYDSTLEAAQTDAFEAASLAQDIATWTRAGTTILVTDAIHKNQLDGIPFHGPAADQWPGIGPRTLVISSSQAGSPAKDGAFGVAFADAIAGAADADSDGRVSGPELVGYLDTRFIGSGQAPVAAGANDASLIVARGVTPGMTAVGAKADVPVVTKDYEVYAAKFVFRDGASQSVTCTDAPVRSCDPSCYVRNFKAGTCTISAVVDGKEVRGKTLALVPGRYDCGLRSDGTLSCHPPQLPTTPAP